MFATWAPRLATGFAVTVGCVAGGVMALMDAPTSAALEPERQYRVKGTLSPSIPTEEQAQPAGQPDVVETPAPATVHGQRSADDLTPSPHDNPLMSASELRRSERLCIRDMPDECVRVADAYSAGSLGQLDKKRASQYRNLGFKAYIRLCEANQPEACYALARMYLHGDGLKANPSYAKNLMRRVVEVCRYRTAEICERLVEEAPMPPERRSRR